MTYCAIAFALVTDALYGVIITSQGPGAPEVYTPPFVGAYLVLAAGLLALSLFGRIGPAARTAMRAGATAGLLVLGVVAAFSIGLPLMLAGFLAAGATVMAVISSHRAASLLGSGAAVLLAVAVLIAGFEATERLIVCPGTGTMAGGGTGFVTGSYHYECVNGQLSFHSGSCQGATSIDASGNVTYSGC